MLKSKCCSYDDEDPHIHAVKQPHEVIALLRCRILVSELLRRSKKQRESIHHWRGRRAMSQKLYLEYKHAASRRPAGRSWTRQGHSFPCVGPRSLYCRPSFTLHAACPPCARAVSAWAHLLLLPEGTTDCCCFRVDALPQSPELQECTVGDCIFPQSSPPALHCLHSWQLRAKKLERRPPGQCTTWQAGLAIVSQGNHALPTL